MSDATAVASPPADLDELVETDVAVHLVFRVTLDWERDRERAVAEMERKQASLRAWGTSPGYRARFGQRPAVLRMRTPQRPPSVVEVVMEEAGVEVEAEIHVIPEPAMKCVICGRAGLSERQVLMSSRGWACPSCHRGWSLTEQARAPAPAADEKAIAWWRRAPLVVALTVVALILVMTFVKLRQWNDVKRELMAPSFRHTTPPGPATTP